MPLRSNPVRLGRLRAWILVLTLVPGAVAAISGHSQTAAGFAAGGLIILLNLLGTQRVVSRFLEGEGIERAVAILVWFGKFGLTAAVILGLLHTRTVAPVALLLGLASLPAALVFDIFLFPVNKGEAKKP